MTPVIKSFFSDMGMEITNEAIQVFGGYGYTRDQGIEQLYRDNRITPIYEGTNSVQAIDLVFRKVLSNKILDKFIILIKKEIKENINGNNELNEFGNILEKKIKILQDFAKWLENKIKIQKDDVSASCNDFLKDLRIRSSRILMVKISKASLKNVSKNKNFYEEKINTANYFFKKITLELIVTIIQLLLVARVL